MTAAEGSGVVPPDGSVWIGDDGSSVRVRGVNGEMIHYDMRDRVSGEWRSYMPLPLSYFRGWALVRNAKQDRAILAEETR